MSENFNQHESSERRPANEPVGDHPADNTAPPSNPEVEADSVRRGEEKLDRLSTH